jgi:hypothetical protein
VYAHLYRYPRGQTFAQIEDLFLDGIHRLFGRTEQEREELGEDEPGEPGLGELRQTLSERRGIGHERCTGLQSLPRDPLAASGVQASFSGSLETSSITQREKEPPAGASPLRKPRWAWTFTAPGMIAWRGKRLISTRGSRA